MYRILIVDDEQLTRDGIERILQKIPQVKPVAKVKDGVEAKKYLECYSVDAVFTDIRMPNMDGLELAAYLSVHKPDVKVVIISCYSDFGYAQQALNYGVKSYLEKPIRLNEVKNIVEKLIVEQRENELNKIWNHDLKKELLELDIYHAIINSENRAENNLNKVLYYAEYRVTVKRAEYIKKNLNEEMLKIGLRNIFRWCSPLSIPIMSCNNGESFEFIILIEEIENSPEINALVERAISLMEIQVNVICLNCGRINELISRNLVCVEQDEIADEIILRAKKYIEKNLGSDITRSDVAREVGLESSYFSKYFKKCCGLSYHEYLQKQRIEKVISLLETGSKVHEAAQQVGFFNGNYFNKIFKQYMGCSPSEFKKKTRKKES